MKKYFSAFSKDYSRVEKHSEVKNYSKAESYSKVKDYSKMKNGNIFKNYGEMKKYNINRNKFSALVLSIAMVISILPFGAITSSAQNYYDDFEYEVLSNGTAEITNYTGSSSIVDIPDEIDGCKVTSIRSFAFSNEFNDFNFNADEVAIPESIENIENAAFFDCNIKSITVDEKNSYYSSQDGVLFNKNKTELIIYPNLKPDTDYYIPDTVETVGETAFDECEYLNYIYIPESVKNIENYIAYSYFFANESLGSAFVSCLNLKYIEVSENNSRYFSENGVLFNKEKTVLIQYPLGINAFEYTIPESVQTVGEGAFSSADNLESVVFGSNVKSIDKGAFLYCSNLKNITFSDNLLTIGDSSFWGCENLTAVSIPYGTQKISHNAFYYCRNLSDITLPDTIEQIGANAFSETEYYANGYNWTDDALYINNYLIRVSGEYSGSFTVREGVRAVAYGAFEYSDVTEVFIPESVINLGGTFFPADNTYSTSNAPFCFNESLTNIVVDENNNAYSSEDGVLFNKEKTELIQYPKGKYGVSYTIPDTVVRIGDNSFYSCDELNEIFIPDSVTSVGESAFFDTPVYNDESNWENNVLYIGNCLIVCRGNIPGDYYVKDGTRVIADRAFFFNTELVSISLPNSVTAIGEAAFFGCDNLKKIVIPNKDCSIGSFDGNGVYNSSEYLEAIPKQAVIYACENSAAQSYAEFSGNEFIKISENPSANMCDINGDGKVSTVDAKWVLQCIAKMRELSEAQTAAADLNGDGRLTVVDVKRILQTVAGMRDVR